MKSRELSVDYDYKYDDLFVYSKENKSKGGIELGSNIVVDFDSGNEPCAIEFIDATEILAAMLQEKLSRKELSGITKARIDWQEKKGALIIKLSLVSKQKQLMVQFITEGIASESKATATA